MPWNSSTKILTRPLNTADIAQATGEVSLDVGTLCKSSKINPFAKYKPLQHAAVGEVTEEERANANFGLSIPGALTDPAQLINATSVWSYTDRTWYRMFDFTAPDENGTHSTKGYYKEAPIVLTCPVGSSGWLINSINELADSTARVPFYAFFKTSVEFQDKRIDESIGISSQSYGHSANELACCIGADELATTNGDMLFASGNDSRFGLALFTYDTSAGTYTFSGAYLCKSVMNPLTSTFGTDYDSFCLYPESCYAYTDTNYSTLTAIPKGTFTAVPFLRISGNKYIPLCKYPLATGAIYPNRFSFGNGMLNMYIPTFRLGESSAAPSTIPASGAIYTTQSSIYAYVYVRNNSLWRHQTSSVWDSTTQKYETIDRWVLTVNIESGNITSAGSPVTFNRTASTARISPSAFTIDPGGSAVLVYRIDHLWSANGVNDLPSVSGSIFVGFNLSYENKDGTLSELGIQAASQQTVYYGTQS